MKNITLQYQTTQQKINQVFKNKEIVLLNKYKQIQNDLLSFATRPSFSRFAVADFEKENINSLFTSNLLPELVRMGEIKNLSVPFLYPFIETNATTFMLNANNSQNVVNMMKSLALRLMCSLPPEKSKFYFSDNNYGSDFSFANSINSETVNYQVLANSEVGQILDDMTLNVTNYNKIGNAAKETNHFIFISNFPQGFSNETISKMRNLINNGNAKNAGIYIFFSLKENELKTSSGIDCNQLLSDSTCINSHSNGLFPQDFYNSNEISFDTISNGTTQRLIDILNKRTVVKKSVSFVKEYENKLDTNDFWKENTATNLQIPIGYSAKGVQNLEFGKDDHFGLIGGLPGKGKSVLLHNIILWGAIKYSPQELSYCLIDCKLGVGMNAYKDLPHTLIQSTSNDRSFGESALQKIIEEMENRAILFKQASSKYGTDIDKIQDYRKVTGQEMPRILVIVDEFQVLFELDDKISGKIGKAMDKIFAQGRFAGIHVLLCSQGIRKIYGLDTSKVTWRLSFELRAEIEAEMILGNLEPLKINKIGSAIINNRSGDKNQNINIQVGFIENITPLVEKIKIATKRIYPNKIFEKWGVSDGSLYGKVENNIEMNTKILNNSFKVNDNYCDVFLGEPSAIRKSHNFIRIRKQSASNVLLIGSDLKSAVSIVGLSIFQLAKQSSIMSKFYIVDCFNIDNKYSKRLEFAKLYFTQLSVIDSKGISQAVDEVETELNNRIRAEEQGRKVTGRIVFSILYAQNCRELRKDGFKDSPVTLKIKRIIKEGPECGIHVFLHSLSYQGYIDLFDKMDVEFENRVVLDNSDASKRILSDSYGKEIKEQGTVLIQIPDELAEANPDSCRVYAEYNLDTNKKNFVTDLINIL